MAVVVLAIIVSASSCATLPAPAQSAGQLSLEVPKAEAATLININTASAPELERLPGVGRGLAERIVAHRQQYGPFRRTEHLLMVRGISDRKFRQLRAMIVVE
jgi:competence protein ComEA